MPPPPFLLSVSNLTALGFSNSNYMCKSEKYAAAMFVSFVTLYSLRPQICLQLGSHAQYIHGILYPKMSIVDGMCVGGGVTSLVELVGRGLRERRVDKIQPSFLL
uniref:Uncharacterized protein n=1 Tax=Ixodes ricinus TaxID=34613 RepID=A0A6B0U8M3_IXORI